MTRAMNYTTLWVFVWLGVLGGVSHNQPSHYYSRFPTPDSRLPIPS
ncbi:MAG: hypothetical protein F6K52_31930 [Moorea sp. SIO3H5]|nr:hypothetical protein [Moorena sp. SIO3H5]